MIDPSRSWKGWKEFPGRRHLELGCSITAWHTQGFKQVQPLQFCIHKRSRLCRKTSDGDKVKRISSGYDSGECLSWMTSSLAPVLNTWRLGGSFPALFKSLTLSFDSVKNKTTYCNTQHYKEVNLTGCNGVFLRGNLLCTPIVRTYLLQSTFRTRAMGIRKHRDFQQQQWGPWIQKQTVYAEMGTCVLWTECPQCFVQKHQKFFGVLLTPRADGNTSYKRAVTEIHFLPWDVFLNLAVTSGLR